MSERKTTDRTREISQLKTRDATTKRVPISEKSSRNSKAEEEKQSLEPKRNPTRKLRSELQLRNQGTSSFSSRTSKQPANKPTERVTETGNTSPAEVGNGPLVAKNNTAREGLESTKVDTRDKIRKNATGEVWNLNEINETRKQSTSYRKLPFQQETDKDKNIIRMIPNGSANPTNPDKLRSANSGRKPSIEPFVGPRNKHGKSGPEVSHGLPTKRHEAKTPRSHNISDSNKPVGSKSSKEKPNLRPIWNATARPEKGKSKRELSRAYAMGLSRLQNFSPKNMKSPWPAYKNAEGDTSMELSRAPSRIDEVVDNDDDQNDEEANENGSDVINSSEMSPENAQPKEALVVEVSNCKLSDLDVEVLVSVDNETLEGGNRVAKELEDRGGEDFVVLKTLVMQMCQQTLPEWNFFVSPGDGELTCKRVFHAHVPSLHKSKDQAAWCSHLGILVWNLMTRADYMGFKSMAIPLLGSGENGAPPGFVIPAICNEIQTFSDGRKKGGYLSEIVVVHPKVNVTKEIEKRLSLIPKTTKTSTSDAPGNSADKTVLCSPCKRRLEKESKDVKRLSCEHVVCDTCLSKHVSAYPGTCPICKKLCVVLDATQPKGFMLEAYRIEDLPGFRKCGTIHMCYLFGDGIQVEGHPHPGDKYKGLSRYAFLPDNRQGRKIYRLLRRAFELGMTFTIKAAPNGQGDVIAWRDIPHKFNIHGGVTQFGYPDPSYLASAEQELARKGIIEDLKGSVTIVDPTLGEQVVRETVTPALYNLSQI